MPEETVNYDNLSEEDQRRLTIAKSMKLMNGVYDKLIVMVASSIDKTVGKDSQDDMFVVGWNSALEYVMGLFLQLKYTREDLDEMIETGTIIEKGVQTMVGGKPK